MPRKKAAAQPEQLGLVFLMRSASATRSRRMARTLRSSIADVGERRYGDARMDSPAKANP
jgi:hypothetical protein